MRYILLDFSSEMSSVLEDLLDNDILKEAAFTAKYKTPSLSYNNILVPLNSDVEVPETTLFLTKQHVTQWQNVSYDDSIYKSIYAMFKKLITEHSDSNFTFTICNILDSSKFGIAYTDGSCTRENVAGWAYCKLTDISPEGNYDPFSKERFLHEEFSGLITEGTNNIGELTAIKVAVEHFDEKPYQIIISDSIYGIKAFREYIHVWKNNGYKTFSKKPIKNDALIKETYKEMKEINNKLIFLKWTKGHADSAFNNICDTLAKSQSGAK